MLNEVKKSVVGTFKDRVYSPLPGTFIISWLITNWELVLFTLTTKKTSIEIISHIKSNYLDLQNIAYTPLAATAIFILIYPWVSAQVTIIWQKANFYKKVILNKMESETPLTVEQSNNIRLQLSEKSLEIDKYHEQIYELEKDSKRYARVISYLAKREGEDIKTFINIIENNEEFKSYSGQEAYARSHKLSLSNA